MVWFVPKKKRASVSFGWCRYSRSAHLIKRAAVYGFIDAYVETRTNAGNNAAYKVVSQGIVSNRCPPRRRST
jgi:hypothetical protein